jgi:uncharacterized phage protein (TIGR01671 family)
MSREIKFRGLDLLSGEWIFGSHIRTGTGLEFICPQNFIVDYLPRYTIDKDTVGQYTGLKVNREQELYEGDIVPVQFSIHLGWKNGWLSFTRNAVVEYIENEMRFMFIVEVDGYGKQYIPFDKGIRQSYKIIGNIHDNPELLEDEQ